MKNLIVRFFPPYANSPTDIPCMYMQEAIMLRDWFVNSVGIKAIIVEFEKVETVVG